MAHKKFSLNRRSYFIILLILIWFGVAIPYWIGESKPRDISDFEFFPVATIDIGTDNQIVASNPGNILLIKTPDFPEYKRLLGLSANTPDEFQNELAAGRCKLIPDGERVEVVASGQNPAWWKIKYQGEGWWIMATFIKDSDGVTWGVADLVEKMSNGD